MGESERCVSCDRWLVDDVYRYPQGTICGYCYANRRQPPASVQAQRAAAVAGAAAKIQAAFADAKPAPSIAENLATVSRLLGEIDDEVCAIRRLMTRGLPDALGLPDDPIRMSREVPEKYDEATGPM